MTECKHRYVAEKKEYQELKTDYYGSALKAEAILNKQDIYIFCVKCGESKKINN